MRPLPGAPGVAAAAALLLLLLPRARADEHEHTVRSAPGRRGSLRLHRRPGRLGAAWSPRRPGRAPRPPGGAFRLGLAEQEPRELGGGISVSSRDGTLLPERLGLLPRPGPKWRRTPVSEVPGSRERCGV